MARRNLERYIKGRPATATYLWREWRTILEQNSVGRIIAVITAKTQKATELRQASPFAGALSPEEIARTIQRQKERALVRYSSCEGIIGETEFVVITCRASHGALPNRPDDLA